MIYRRGRTPATLLLSLIWLLIAALAGAEFAAAGAVSPAAGLILGDVRDARLRLVRIRCEESFLDFVELMWPVVDPGAPFHRGKVQEAIALHLEAITAGLIENFLGNVPPGSTKTYLANVFWPAWEWGPRNRPDLRYMSWSYAYDLSEKANDDCRKVIKHHVYQQFWGDRFALDDSSDAKGYYQTDKGGWRRASSTKGASTGFRADRLIFDDPHNAKDADSPAELAAGTNWFARSLPTRVRNMGGDTEIAVPWWVRDVHGMLDDDPDDKRPVVKTATVGIMQRIHRHDISDIILRNPALNYEILIIEMHYRGAEHPARKLPTWRGSSIRYRDWREAAGELADPVRQPEVAVERLKAQMLSAGVSGDVAEAQLEQWPSTAAGVMFTDSWLPIIEPSEAPGGVDKRGWDFAGSERPGAAETATARVRRGTDRRFYLMDSDGIIGGPGAVDKFIAKHHARDPIALEWSVPRDPGQAGIHQVAYIVRELTVGRVVHSSREVGKVISAEPVSSQAEHGNFVIVRHPGCDLTRQQLIDFPYGLLKDRVDAISRAFSAHVMFRTDGEDFAGEVGDASGMLISPVKPPDGGGSSGPVSPPADWST